MVAQEIALRHKLPYLVHAGLVEIRNLAYESAHGPQIAKLADVLEFLPRYLEDDRDPDEATELIREQFQQYATEFPGTWFGERALAIIDGMDTPSNY